jgi:hypothetical protein
MIRWFICWRRYYRQVKLTVSCLIYGLFLCSMHVTAQSRFSDFSNSQSLQYGVSLKAAVEFNCGGYKQPNPNIRISINGGIASYFLNTSVYPSLNEEIEMYNGGIGSKNRFGKGSPFTLDFITAITVTAGIKDHFIASKSYLLKNRYAPLYYFSEFIRPCLQNPYSYSISAGTDFIFSTDKEKTSQRIGFLNIHFDRVQVSYYNDGGTPVNQTHLGDMKDRYYTGGAVISYNGPINTFLNDVRLSYSKFTGFTKNAFEASNKLNLAYVYYHDQEQKFYNKSTWSVSAGNVTNGWELGVRSYNYVVQDVQHLIHFGLLDSYHIVPYKPYTSIFAGYNLLDNNTGIR